MYAVNTSIVCSSVYCLKHNDNSTTDVVNEQFEQGSACDVMRLYKSKRQKGTEFIEVNRMQMSLVRQMMRIYTNPQFQLTKSLDVHFLNEQRADLRGATKEFFHDTLACFANIDPGGLIPFYGVDAVATGCFEIAGKAVARILHDGQGFVGLAPCLQEYLVTGCVDEAMGLVSLDDLPDLNLKQILEEVTIKILFLAVSEGKCFCSIKILIIYHTAVAT